MTRLYSWFSALMTEDTTHMEDLLVHGLPVDVPHPLRHTTALMEATRLGRTALVQWLLTRGAAPAFLSGIPRGTPLHCAVRYHQFAIAHQLLDAATTAAVLDSHGRTPLHVLSMDLPEQESLSAQAVSVAARLIDKGCPLDALDDEGITALHYSIISGDAALAQLLLTCGANPNIQSPDTAVSPLTIAALEKNVPLAQLLLDYGANALLPSRDGSTPLTIMPSLKRLVQSRPAQAPSHRANAVN